MFGWYLYIRPYGIYSRLIKTSLNVGKFCTYNNTKPKKKKNPGYGAAAMLNNKIITTGSLVDTDLTPISYGGEVGMGTWAS